jgi:signal peptidase I
MATQPDVKDLETIREAVVEARLKTKQVFLRKARRAFWRELPIIIVAAVTVAVLVKAFLVQPFWIPSGSMQPTFAIGDRIAVNRLADSVDDLHRGDIIVFDAPEGGDVEAGSLIGRIVRSVTDGIGITAPQSEYVKRVVAFPGETVEVRDGTVLVDGDILVEPYLEAPMDPFEDFGPETVPSGHVFVMGDNRNLSVDSRVFGPVPEDDIVGRVFVIMWPPSRWSSM